MDMPRREVSLGLGDTVSAALPICKTGVSSGSRTGEDDTVKEKRATLEHTDKKNNSIRELPNFFSLPAEIIEVILSHCNLVSLRRLSQTSKALYLYTIPLIHRGFRPSNWMEIAKLARLLTKGKGPASLDRRDLASAAAKSMRAITTHLEALFTSHACGETNFCYSEDIEIWAADHTMDCLVDIVECASSLHSFTCHVLLHGVDADPLWEALAKTSLRELDVAFSRSPRRRHIRAEIYDPFAGPSKLWSMQNLTKIHLGSVGEFDTPSFLRLLRGCPYLQDLKVVRDHLRHTQWRRKVLSEIAKQRQLLSLDLENVDIKYKEKDFTSALQFLQALPELKRLRVVHTEPYACRQSRMDMKHPVLKELLLSAVEEVEISDVNFLIDVLRHSQPYIVRNVRCRDPGDYGRDDGDDTRTTMLRTTLSDCVSIREVSLLFYNYRNEDPIESLLRSVPQSVERLAIRMPRRDIHDAVDYMTPTVKYVQSLDHLPNLTRLVLPWDALFLTSTLQGWGGEIESEANAVKKAIDIACSLDNPRLDYVFFQGSRSFETKFGTAADWAPRFGAYDDLGKRFTVKISRIPIDVDKELEVPRDGRISLGQGVLIQGEVIGTSCLCRQCYMVEDLEVEKRFCNKD